MFYNEKVLEHFFNPKNIGEIEDADGVGIIGDPECGDCIKVYIKVKDRRLADVKFKVYGCPAAIGTSSITTELAIGRTLEEAYQIGEEDVVRALGGLPDQKIHCSVLCPAALRLAILDYISKLEAKKRYTPTHEGALDSE
ncbi:MAG: iron-sulfur cluster assembly scaffold protein [Firmicutes bacterium]|nr:iron-sulfur cluster assembly scaffold protein [Bacillota bacterium]HXL03525.1 iron-sulfur cluster assembly scaffold protein [Bacillota bacterium]